MENELIMKSNLEINNKEKYVLVSINPKIYPLNVVMSVAYIFTNNYFVLLDGEPKEEIIIELKSKNKTENLEQIGREFNNELINYSSYQTQSIKNNELRKEIFKRVMLTNSENENFLEDNSKQEFEEIAKPWEEEKKN